jgi:hypothetical protein
MTPIFLLTGPAIPDISLVIVCIFFLFYFFKNKNLYLSNNFFNLSIMFWIILFLLNLISLNFYKSLSESIIFLRMLLLPIIMYLWLLKDNNHIKIILLIILISNLIVIGDTLYQFFNYHPFDGFGEGFFNRKAEFYGRLSGPFLDMVPGSYIAKFFIFGFLGLIIFIKKKITLLFFSILYLTICGYITFISGERMALATFLLAMSIGILILKSYRLLFSISLFFLFTTVFITYNTHDHYKNFTVLESNSGHLGLIIEKYDPECDQSINCSKIIRLQPSISEVLKNFSNSAYYETFSLSLEMIKVYPWTGIGMNNFNFGCLNIEIFKKERCWSHPHNFYLQWLTENGIIGFILFITYIFFIFYKVLQSDSNITYNKYSFIALSVIFWPIMSTGSLLKNWHGIETFFIIGLSLALLNFKKNTR